MHPVLLPKNSWYIEEQISLQAVEVLTFINIIDKEEWSKRIFVPLLEKNTIASSHYDSY